MIFNKYILTNENLSVTNKFIYYSCGKEQGKHGHIFFKI